jgi:hypothetical protein
VLRKHPLERAPLEAAEGVLPVHVEHLAQLRAGFLFDFAVELHERHLQELRQLRAERGLACAAQADERDALARRRLAVFLHQRFDRHAHGTRDLAQQQHRDVSLARFELREVALGHLGGSGEGLARGAAFGAPGAHALAQPRKEDRLLLRLCQRCVHAV